MTQKIVRTRFAPSPTGFLHVGSLRTALYAYALARKNEGQFILRIEDTDQKREVEGATEALKNTLSKFRITWDEFYVQSERHKTGIYKMAAEKLVKEGHAFYCQCSPKNAKEEGYSNELRDACRDKNLDSGAIKLKVPENEKVSYFDFVHKKAISWDTNTVYDATLLKSDGFPTYHLAAMVDDLDMKVSHILRGHDWLPSTPVHLLVFKFLGADRPEIGHLTDILSSITGKKLSKRRDSVFVENFLEDGILPQALLNFVMLLGWAPKDNSELFTLEEFVKKFDINGFGDANPRFLEEKLLWFNSQYLQNLSDEDFAFVSRPFVNEKISDEILLKIAPLVKSRIKKLSELDKFVEYIYTIKDPLPQTPNYKEHIEEALHTLKNITDWSLENINNSLMEVVSKKQFKTGKFFQDLRGTIAGSPVSPPINESMEILGSLPTISRLENGLRMYNKNSE